MYDKLNNMSAGEVWEIVWTLKNKFDDSSDMVFTIALDVLESKVSESKFLELAENL